MQDKRFKNRELQIMRVLDHPNVVKLKHCFYSTNEKEEVYLNLVGQCTRGLNLFASQLELSDAYGMGVALRGCVACVNGVLGVCRVFICVRHGTY